MEDVTPSLITALLEAALDAKTATIVPNRREKRRLGSRSGFYRMPRTTPKGTGTANHWLARLREEEAFLAAQRSTEVLRVGGRRNGRTARSAEKLGISYEDSE